MVDLDSLEAGRFGARPRRNAWILNRSVAHEETHHHDCRHNLPNGDTVPHAESVLDTKSLIAAFLPERIF